MNKKNSKEKVLVDAKKLNKLRKSLNKTIDEFKESIQAMESAQKEPEGETLEQWVAREFGKPSEEKAEIIPAVEEKELVSPSQESPAPYADVDPKPPQKIWQAQEGVHVFFVGVDNEINSNVRLFLQKIGMRTFVPAMEGHGNKAIVEQIALHNDFTFAVVVLSADEYMFQKVQDPKNALLVANQKTVFELGFLIGKLGRNRVAVFYQENEKFKRPTEYFDILYTPYDTNGQWQQKLLRQMQSSGIVIHEKEITVI